MTNKFISSGFTTKTAKKIKNKVKDIWCDIEDINNAY